ncbi:chemotaxis protein CheB [Pareuzebyella sediminis]|uniref:chemotaxis protein CheB n=1 Tax=Pareuzebyella sediminis TaxID=2607998 RepID=UPI0011EDECA0|nr:chemotaxis protein CheB [Pareuzebyella sediminis]
MKEPSRIFVMGASSGGRKVIVNVLRDFPENCNAAFLVVVHASSDTPSIFHQILSKKIKMKVFEAEHGMTIQKGSVILAKPNQHLFVSEGKALLSNGPRENLFRPAIDVLFRSAAVAYGNSCTGILLSGRLNDGAAGLEAIKKCGGLVMIQNPATAEFSDMPSFAAETVDVDYVVNEEDMCHVLLKVLEEEKPRQIEIPQTIIRENTIATRIGSQVSKQNSLGNQVPISCSTCGGPLWKIKDSKINRYRCHVGHAFTEEALLKSQNEALEEALWVALRTLEEKKMLLERVYGQVKERRGKTLVVPQNIKIDEVQQQTNKLRNVLQIPD